MAMISERSRLTLKLTGFFAVCLLVKASPLVHHPVWCLLVWVLLDLAFLLVVGGQKMKEIYQGGRLWAFQLAFIVSFISKMVILPDLYFFFHGENRIFAFPLTALAYLLIAACYAVLYGVLFQVASLLQRKSVLFLVAWLPLLNLLELGFLYGMPLVYPFSLPLPVVNQRYSLSDKHNHVERDIILVDPKITEEHRKTIRKLGYAAQDILGQKVARGIATSLRPLSEKVTLFFPETTFYFNPGDYLGLSKSISAHLGKEVDIYGGSIQPGRNSVVYAGRVRRFPMAGIVYEKTALVPFVEKETFGYSIRGETNSSLKKTKNMFLSLDKMTPVGKIFKHPRFAICYEGLMAQSWMGERTLFLFTNQQSFHLIGILGGLFDTTLLQLAALFRKNLVLIGNFGKTGLYLYRKSAVPNSVRIRSMPFQLYDGNVQGVLGSEDKPLY